MQNELTFDEREALLASTTKRAFARSSWQPHSPAARSAHQPPNAQSDYVTYAFERFAWSEPLFVLALYAGLRRSDLRLLK